MSGVRTGIFGGAFDPIHNGHLAIAEAARTAAGLDRIIFLPVGEPAHRRVYAPAADRREMVALAIAGHANFSLDETALIQSGPVYTADTLELLRAKFPGNRLSFIAGVDSLAKSVWRRLDEVAAALERFYLTPRRGVRQQDVDRVLAELPPQLRSKFELLPIPPIDISGTHLRARVAAGKSIREFVPAAVADYVEKRGLYKP